jgi:DNA-directed RNA polymerase specialized sigma24 family protein
MGRWHTLEVRASIDVLSDGLGVASYLQGNLMRHLWCAGMEEHGAADVFQTVFTRLVKHLPRRRDADKLQAWCLDERPRSRCFQCTTLGS